MLLTVLRFYALFKIHNLTLASRPIISNVETSSHKLARFLSQSLAHLTCNNLYTMKNSCEFVDKLKLISPPNYTMLSLNWIAWKKSLREFYYSSIEIEEVLNLVYLCVRLTAFVYNGAFYSQIEGLEMGNPLSPLICDIYMHYFEEKHFNVHKFLHRFRYVNDTFILVPSNTNFSG